jgi:hypothetical protein
MLLVGLMACEEDDGLVFTASQSEEAVSFSNSFAAEYLLTSETEDNIAERFVWPAADFGAPVNVTYEVHGSIDPQFGEFELIGSTSETNLAITVSKLLDFAEELGLDDDPTTTTATGGANNMGQVYFRLKAFTGSGAANAVETISDGVALNITIVERVDTGGGCASYWVVGGAAVDAGWAWDTPIEFTCDNDVYTAHINLTNDTFRFFSAEGDWASGLNYPYFAGEGYTIDASLEDAMDGDNNFRFTGTPGIYELVIDDPNKTITLTPSVPLYLVGEAIVATGWAWDNRVELSENNTYVWSGSVELTTGTFRFFTVDGDWNSGRNYPYYVDAGYTIDSNFEDAADGDSNFRFVGTPGTYTLTVNEKDKTITLQ